MKLADLVAVTSLAEYRQQLIYELEKLRLSSGGYGFVGGMALIEDDGTNSASLFQTKDGSGPRVWLSDQRFRAFSERSIALAIECLEEELKDCDEQLVHFGVQLATDNS